MNADRVVLLGLAEVAKGLKLSKQRASELTRKTGFPEPVAVLASGPIWTSQQLEAFQSGQSDSGHSIVVEDVSLASLVSPCGPARSQTRQRVMDALAEHGELPLRLYQAAIDALDDGGRLDRTAVVAFEIRELLDVLAPPIRDAGRIPPNLKGIVVELSQQWDKVCADVDLTPGGKSTVTPRLRKFLAKCQTLFADAKGLPRPDAGMKAFLLRTDFDSDDRSLPGLKHRIKEWSDLRRRFTSLLHHEPAEESEIYGLVSRFEELLLSWLRPASERRLAEIDSLILEAEKAGVPRDKAQGLLQMLDRGVKVRYFYSHINAPGWFAALKALGQFKKPAPVRREGDSVSFPDWPQTSYLLRVAPLIPADVMRTIQESEFTENSRVLADFIRVAAAAPPLQAAIIVGRAIEWSEQRFASFLLHDPLVDLALCLLGEASTVPDGQRLADSLIRLDPGPPTKLVEVGAFSFQPPSDPKSRFEHWSYDESLKKLMPALLKSSGLQGFDLLVNALDHALGLAAEGRRGTDKPRDLSTIWYRSFGPGERFLHEELQSLVAIVQHAALNLIDSTPKEAEAVIRRLVEGEWDVMQRLALHVAALRVGLMPNVVAQLLMDPAMLANHSVLNEFVELMASGFSHLSPAQLEQLVAAIKNGPDRNAIAQRHAKLKLSEHVDAYVAASVGLWQRDRLTPIRNSLSHQDRDFLEALEREFGPYEPNSDVVEFLGPTSPLDGEEIRSMDVHSLIAYVRGWVPSRGWREPTPEGLGRLLGERAKGSPDDFAQAAVDLQGLHPTYVRNILFGISEAVRKGARVRWDGLMELARWVLDQPVEAVVSVGDGEDEDLDWKGARRQVADVLLAGLASAESGLRDLEPQKTWTLLSELVDDADPSVDDEERYGRGQGAVTYALNCTRGRATDAVFEFARWQGRDGRGLPDEVSAELARRLDPAVEPSQAVRSVFGRWFPVLVALDPLWAEEHWTDVFSEDELGLVAWESYLHFSRAHENVVALVRRRYSAVIEALDRGSALTDVPDGDAHVADHSLALYLSGREGLNDGLFATLRERAYPKLIEHIVVQIWRALSDNENVDSGVCDRVMKWWDLQSAGFSPTEQAALCPSFGYLFDIATLDDAWRLKNLEDALTKVHSVSMDFRVVEGLVAGSPRWLRSRLRCLRLLISQEKKPYNLTSWSKKVRPLVEQGLLSVDAETRLLSEDIGNILIAAGSFDFRQVLASDAIPGGDR